MVHIIKIYLDSSKSGTQIRRLAVSSEIVAKFDLLAQKIQDIFQPLASENLEFTWKDDENDTIHMSSDEELAQALANANDGLLRIYVRSTATEDPKMEEKKTCRNPTYNDLHANVVCDGCDKTIQGFRYKCLQCPNYDICSVCNAENTHDHHDMVKLARNSFVPRKWVFHGGRYIWRSMFGRCPISAFTPKPSQQSESTSRTEAENSDWQAVLQDLLSGDCVSAQKLFKDNFQQFVNFMDTATGGIDVRLENTPCKANTPSKVNTSGNDQDSSNTCVKTKQEGYCFSKVKPTPIVVTPTKAAQVESDSSITETVQAKEPQEKLINGISQPVPSKINSTTPKPYSAARLIDEIIKRQIKETPLTPRGLFSDNEPSNDWLIVNEQDIEKSDATPTEPQHDNGAKPEISMYPVIDLPSLTKPETVPAGACADASPKENMPLVDEAVTIGDHNYSASPEKWVFSDVESAMKSDEIFFKNLNDAMRKMKSMGFSNEGGWLERLLISKNGNINDALDALYSNTRQQSIL